MKHAVKIATLFGLLTFALPIVMGAMELQVEGPSLVEAVRQGNVDTVRILIHALGDKARPGKRRRYYGYHEECFTLLQVAVENDDTEMATFLLDLEDVDPNEDPNGDGTALYYAQSGNMVSLLTERGAQIEGGLDSGNLLLFSDIATDEAFKALLDKGANLRAINHDDDSLLQALLENFRWTRLDILLHHPRAADDNQVLPLLHMLAYKGNRSDIAGELLLPMADINEKDTSEMTPLHWAALGRNMETAEYLLSNGANPNMEDEWNRSPLHYATARKNKPMINLLLTHGASQTFNAQEDDYFNGKMTELSVAVQGGDIALVRRLLEGRNNSTNRPETQDLMPLHLAAKKGHEDIVRLLLDAGERVDSRLRDGKTPLHCSRNPAITDLLLQHGADVNCQCSHGETALHQVSCCSDIASLLLQQGANVNLQDYEGNTPLHDVVKYHYLDIEKAQQLLGNGEIDCDLEIKNNTGATPLSRTIKRLEKEYQNQMEVEQDCREHAVIIVRDPKDQKRTSTLKSIAHLLVSRGADIRQLPQIHRACRGMIEPFYRDLRQGPYVERLRALQEYFRGLQEEHSVPLDVSRTIASMLHTPEEVKTILPTR